MKTDVMPSKVQMEYGLLKDLLTEVKETIASDFKVQPAPRRFVASDLWRIRKNLKSANSRFKG
jgi:hypothetical protein